MTLLTLDLGLAILAIALAFIPLLTYTVSRTYYRSSIQIRVGGEQSGDPIPLPSEEGDIFFGITTEMKRGVAIEELRVSFNPTEVEIADNPDAVKQAWSARTETGTANLFYAEKMAANSSEEPRGKATTQHFPRDSEFPSVMRIPGSPLVTKGFVKVYAWHYKAASDKFQVRVSVDHKLEEREVKAPWDMYPPKLQTLNKVLTFRADKISPDPNEHTLRYGFALKPKESMVMGESLEKK